MTGAAAIALGLLAATSLAGAAAPAPPDPLTLCDGRRVTTVAQWQHERRPEILELFRAHVYGRAPVERPADLKFDLTATDEHALDDLAIRQEVAISFRGPGGRFQFHVTLFTPKRATAPAPCFLLINHRARSGQSGLQTDTPYWPVARILARGYATATFVTPEVAPDRRENAGAREGVFPVFDAPAGRAPDAWATIAAWAWAASRALDFLVTQPAIDARRIAVIGHSRGGKAALWAGAQDERFALVVSNESGCTGAALARGKTGERIADINRQFPHWFCANYHAYANREDELPVDQHLLLAAIAPRPLAVGSASDDHTADPRAEFRSCVLAGPVYQLHGQPDLGATQFPPPQQPLTTGRIGYHLRAGSHGLTEYDWARYLDFADLNLRIPSPPLS